MIIAAFLGVSLLIWGCLCLVVALLYLFLSPHLIRGRQSSYAKWRFLVLRWFHSLVWLLLALSCFLWGEHLSGGAVLANVLALIALAIYLVFIVAFIVDRKAQNRA